MAAYVEPGYVEKGYIEGDGIIGGADDLKVKHFVTEGSDVTRAVSAALASIADGQIGILYSLSTKEIAIFSPNGAIVLSGKDVDVGAIVNSPEMTVKLDSLASSILNGEPFARKVAELAPQFDEAQFLDSQEFADKVAEVSPPVNIDSILDSQEFADKVKEIAPPLNSDDFANRVKEVEAGEVKEALLRDDDLKNSIANSVKSEVEPVIIQESKDRVVEDMDRYFRTNGMVKVEIWAQADQDPVILGTFGTEEVEGSDGLQKTIITLPPELVGEQFVITAFHPTTH